MKTLQILTITALLSGLAQAANAAQDDTARSQGMPMHHHTWQDADANKDGVITHDEFMSAHQTRSEEMFTKLDTNKDGKVDETEQKAMQSKCERRHNHK